MNKASVLAFLDAEIERLQEARQLLSGGSGSARNGSRHSVSRGGRKRRQMSEEAKRRISLSQKKRWAARKKAQR